MPILYHANHTGPLLQTPGTAAPTLTRVSLNQQAALARKSVTAAATAASSGAGSGASSPKRAAPPSLARVSAQQYPNLARASLGANLSRQSAGFGGLSRPSNNLSRTSVAKAQQELERRAAESIDACTVQVCVEDKTAGQPAVFKGDGQRFAHSRFTLKLQQVRL